MVLTPILDSVDELPEPIREHYRQADDGKFVLDVQPVDGWSLENVAGLKSTLAKKNAAEKALAKKLEAFGDMDPDTARDALSKLDEIKDWSPDDKVKEQMRSVEKQLTAKHQKELGEAKARGDTLFGALDDKLRRSELVAAIARHKGNTDLLVPIGMAQTSVIEDGGQFMVRVLDGEGTHKISGKQGSTDPMDIDEFVEGLKKDKRYMAAFEGLDASGSGSRSAGGDRATGLPDNASPIDRIKHARSKAR